jgi:hypothetical protein
VNKFSLLALLVAFFVAGTTFAADVKPVAATGTVVSYTAADTVKNTPAVLVVKVADKSVSFVVDAKTVVAGKDKKAVAVTTLKAGDAVAVEYTVGADKANTAVSVTLQ